MFGSYLSETKVDFGIFNTLPQRDRQKPVRQIYADVVEQTMLAEQLGLSRFWYAEHHFNNFGLTASPLMLVAHMAARTRTIRLGPAVVVAPLYNPARLLAEIGMADILSDGRLELGIGSGYQEYEFARFGVDLANVQDITHEMLELIRRGLTQKVFEFKGKYLSMPQSAISTRPLQSPHPPMWLAGSAEKLVRWIIRHDQNLLIAGALGGVTRMKKMRESCEQLAIAEGKDPKAIKIGISRLAFPTKSKADAIAYAEQGLYTYRVASSLKDKRENIVDNMVQESPYKGEPTVDDILRNLPIGDVDTCIERTVRMIRELNPVHIMTQPQIGGVDARKSIESMTLWATEVVPAVQRELGITPAAASAVA